MSAMRDDTVTEVRASVQQQKDRAARSLVSCMLVLAAVAVPISLSRVATTGWQPAYALHVFGLLLTAGLFTYRKRLTEVAMMSVILCITTIIAVTGLLTYGLIGNGVIWAVFSLFLAMAFLNMRVAALVGIILTGTFAFSMYMFTSGGRTFPGDTDLYLASLPAWGTAFFGGLVFNVLIVTIVFMLRHQTEDILLLLEQKNKQIKNLADHDDLTGLPVYRVFVHAAQQSLLQAQRENRHIAVLFIDLDEFKEINDQFGHEAGDEVLKSVATDLRESLRSSDVVSRMGGDEFVVLTSSDTPLDIEGLCERMLALIGKPRLFDGQSASVGASIGVSQYSNQGETAEQLIQQADKAMYLVKAGNKNGFWIDPVPVGPEENSRS